MKIDPETALLDSCKQRPSPNRDQRPAGMPVELVVVHSISLPPGEYGGDAIERFFQNRLDLHEHPYYEEIGELRVSAHVLIRRDGEMVQFVPFDERAWHAGQSSYMGRERCNDYSIGIELEGTDSDAFEELQYTRLASLIAALRERYPDIGDNITSHSEIAPGRKTDPGTGFDWPRLMQYLSDVQPEQQHSPVS